MVRCAITSAMVKLQTHPQFFEQPSPRSCTSVSLEHLRRHRSPKHPSSTPARSFFFGGASGNTSACGSERPAGDRSRSGAGGAGIKAFAAGMKAIHGNGLRDGAAAAATSWGSGPGLVGGARPPSTAEITFHAAIRAAISYKTGTRARSGDSVAFQPFQIRKPES